MEPKPMSDTVMTADLSIVDLQAMLSAKVEAAAIEVANAPRKAKIAELVALGMDETNATIAASLMVPLATVQVVRGSATRAKVGELYNATTRIYTVAGKTKQGGAGAIRFAIWQANPGMTFIEYKIALDDYRDPNSSQRIHGVSSNYAATDITYNLKSGHITIEG
jgi:hypothetical protein